MTSARLSRLELNGQLLFIGRGQVDLKTHVSAIDLEIDDDAVIREPRGFYRAVRDTVPSSSITNIGHGGENNNFEVV